MKRVTNLLIPLASLSLLAAPELCHASYVSDVLASNPTVYYRLGESSGTTAVDSSGNGYNGVYGSAVTLGATGIAGAAPDTAASFVNSANSKVTVSGGVNGGAVTGDYTEEMWIKPTALPTGINWANLIFRSNVGSEATTFSDILQLQSNGTILNYTFDGGAKTVTSTAKVNLNQWNYIVGVYRPGAANSTALISIWVNGVKTAVTNYTLGNPFVGNEWLLAKNHGSSPPASYTGSIDEVAVYDTVLSDSTILAHYADGLTVAVPTPAALPAGLALLGLVAARTRRR